ncbi:MAG: phosphocholine cytidylyltransferase family protein [Bacteroidetes bacterium]|nr:phosphocholine cytidylyltransferase family protein [Bacteroidota bacterium]
MKAVILAAGIASRLRPLTDGTPKCLLALGGKTILQRTIDNLLANGVDSFVIVTGYLHEQIEAFMRTQYPHLRPQFLHNDLYASTNNIYSLWLTRETVRGENILLLDSDILFDARIVGALLASPHENSLALNRDIAVGEEEIKVRLDEEQRIREISKVIPLAAAAGESIGIERFSSSFVDMLFVTLEEMVVQEKRVDIFYEAAFERVIERGCDLFAVDISEFPCMELDTVEDFRAAQRHILPELS